VRVASDDAKSPWADRFRNGATIYPRMLFFVTRQPAGPLGMPRGRVAVRSLQRANDKKPWKGLPPLDGVVETEFLRPVLFGENILPFRVVGGFEAVVPWDRHGLMDDDRLDAYDGLAAWWRAAEGLWEKHRPKEGMTLLEQLDYQGKFRQQFPTQPERIVYTKSGMHLAAARVSDPRAVIDHKLYWATAASTAEAQYLCAVLNTAAFTELVRPYMSYGKDERDFNKHIWQLPVPLYDPADERHARLAACGSVLEAAVAAVELPADLHFAAVRRRVRQVVAESDAGREAEGLVRELLG
jgi:hypothetical protein